MPDGWISKYGHAQKRQLYCLRLVRNAFVHTNSDLAKLNPSWLGKTVDESKGMPADITAYVGEFAADLSSGNIKDDKGNVWPAYLKVTDSVAELCEDSEDMIISLCIKLFHRRDNAAAENGL
ncbi:MAG: hypothetical protein O7D86_02625 [Proteobacteria bacterium]|nr:hypothetical protein [Pseudomonadota bacterium]